MTIKMFLFFNCGIAERNNSKVSRMLQFCSFHFEKIYFLKEILNYSICTIQRKIQTNPAWAIALTQIRFYSDFSFHIYSVHTLS